MALGFLKKLGEAVALGGIITVSSFGLGGVPLALALRGGSITAGLSLLDRLTRRRTRVDPTTKGVSAVPSAPAQFALGTSRTEGVLVFLRQDGQDLHLVYAVSEGACAGLGSNIYLDGEQKRIKPVVGSTGEYEPAFAIDQGTLSLWTYTAATGIQGGEFFAAINPLRPANSQLRTPWLEGVSWVYVKLTQPERRRYTQIPKIEFEWRGLVVNAPRHRIIREREIAGTVWSDSEADIASPAASPEARLFGIKVRLHNADASLYDETRIWNGTTWVALDAETGDIAEFTSSAAALRYWWLTVYRGVPHAAIDRTSVIEADRICSAMIPSGSPRIRRRSAIRPQWHLQRRRGDRAGRRPL